MAPQIELRIKTFFMTKVYVFKLRIIMVIDKSSFPTQTWAQMFSHRGVLVQAFVITKSIPIWHLKADSTFLSSSPGSNTHHKLLSLRDSLATTFVDTSYTQTLFSPRKTQKRRDTLRSSCSLKLHNTANVQKFPHKRQVNSHLFFHSFSDKGCFRISQTQFSRKMYFYMCTSCFFALISAFVDLILSNVV